MATTGHASMSKATQPSKKTLADGGGVLLLGLPRSGTYSVVHALRILGHNGIFHNLDVPIDSNNIWGEWVRPMWACSPWLRHNIPRPYFTSPNSLPLTFRKADWDDILGRTYQGIGDMSVYFVEELIEAYPDAQVILWQRDIDSWYESYVEGMLRGFGYDSWTHSILRNYIVPFSKVYWHTTMWYGVASWLRADTFEKMQANARTRYEEHFQTVRKLVKPGKLLEFRLQDGWAPLCKFLDCPVPNEPFPHLNEGERIKAVGKQMNRYALLLAIKNLMLRLVILVACTGSLVWWYKRYGAQ